MQFAWLNFPVAVSITGAGDFAEFDASQNGCSIYATGCGSLGE
jgi:hypothetical protein